jgi:type I restriction enzyme R subunit
MMTPMPSANFDFLKVHEPSLVTLGAQAEQYFRSDPNTCLIKLRQFGEMLAQLTAAKTALFTSPDEAQPELLRRLKFAGAIPGETGELFYKLRSIGNRATHSGVI